MSGKQDKWCPLKNEADRDPSNGVGFCDQQNCAWWKVESRACCILDIADVLWTIDNTILGNP